MNQLEEDKALVKSKYPDARADCWYYFWDGKHYQFDDAESETEVWKRAAEQIRKDPHA